MRILVAFLRLIKYIIEVKTNTFETVDLHLISGLTFWSEHYQVIDGEIRMKKLWWLLTKCENRLQNGKPSSNCLCDLKNCV